MTLVDYVSLYPTASAILTGLLASVITFYPPRKMMAKRLYIFVFTFLAVTAIAALVWQQSIISKNELIRTAKDELRNKKEADRDIAVSYMEGQMTSLVNLSARGSSQKQLRDQLTSELALFSKKITPSFKKTEILKTEKALNLKEKTLLIAYKLREVFTERQKVQLLIEKSPTPVLQLQDYNTETVNIYAQNFAQQVTEIHDAFIAKGIRDGLFEVIYSLPKYAGNIINLSYRLEYLAKKLE